MDKPATLLQREFKDNLVKIINESKLPAFVLVPILEQALAEVKDIEQKQYEADKAAYEQEEVNADNEL